MKLITVGFTKKIIDVEDSHLKSRKRDLDNLHLALNTKHNPFKKPIQLQAKDPFNDPDLFLVRFERVL